MRVFLWFFSFLVLVGCVDTEETPATEKPASAAFEYSAFMQTRERKPQQVSEPPIQLSVARAICRDAIELDRSLVRVLAKHGRPQAWRHTGQAEWAYWKVAENASGIESITIFHNRAGRIRNVAFMGPDGVFGGASYWMDANEYCVPGVLFDQRPRAEKISESKQYLDWQSQKPADLSSSTTARNIFSVATGFQTAKRGPSDSKGAVYYFGGHSTARPTPITDNVVPPYVVSLNSKGWDVYRANPPIKYRNSSSRSLLVENMNRLAAEAKAEGYRKVVFIGQSFGGWNILRASENAQFDKYIAVVPATFGMAKNARNRSKWESSMLEIVPMSQKSRVSGLVFLFEGDEFYTPRVQDGVANARYQNVSVVDRPAGFNGHGASWLDAFDYVYGDCLARYLTSPGRGFSCPKKSLSLRDHRWMTNKTHLEQGGATLVDANEARSILQGNTIAGRAGSDLINVFFANKQQMLVEFRSGYNNGDVQRVPFGLNGSTLCARAAYFQQNGSNGCYSLYKWPRENLYIAVAEHGGIVFRGQLLPGNPRNLR
ncbi:hypothetical protein [Cognatishimia activa]|uniref:Alpha/beta hydrolase family protein n=1 Tax=Cognatishimia activa TaxID=1715691 RepID=A0A975ERI1_9RHOB|nr:hypothetical protein [Cognatishimia activa]QTN36799.1 hypothetical protein HZ995_04595 [Cognatishimia activa]